MLAIQFFVLQVVVQWGWTTPFSLAHNFISDLGNTACAPYPAGSTQYVCSPWHGWMNASFVALGISKIGGAPLVRRCFGAGWLPAAGLGLLAVAGCGDILVGLYPENVDIGRHKLGAALTFLGGNLAIVLLGGALLARRAPRALPVASAAGGILGLAATVLLVQDQFLGLGVGGMERVAAYPVPLFLMTAGAWIWREGRGKACKP
jgi:hypothetical membrane protein